jgi:hypothetical protein
LLIQIALLPRFLVWYPGLGFDGPLLQFARELGKKFMEMDYR